MIYECEKCGNALPAGVLACPKCGEGFDEVVPQDAETPKRGWQAKSETVIPPPTPTKATAPEPVVPEQPIPYPDYILPSEKSFVSLSPSVQEPSLNGNSGLQKFLAYAGVTALVIGIATVVYYLNFFSVTVTTPQISILGQSIGGGEVNNVGLLSDRQNGLIVGISVTLLGAILLISGIFVDVRNGAKNISASSLVVYAVILSCVISGGIYGAGQVKHQQIVKVEDREADENLKMIGLGIIQFTQDHDENFPPMSDVPTLQNALKPYISNDQTFVNPVTSQPFTPNSKCSNITLSSIASPSDLVIMYDEVPESNGSRWVLYADGHTHKRTAEYWASVLLKKKPNKPYNPSDTNYESTDTLFP
jgi:hypothetical protein